MKHSVHRKLQQFTPQYEFELLEGRFLLAITPATPRADTLGAAFDAGERQVLLNRITNLDAATRSNLQSKLNTGVGAFDSALLSYMRSRNGPKFFFDPDETDEIGDFIVANNISYSDLRTHGDAVTDHLFPEQYSSGIFNVQLPANINWIAPTGSTNPEFLHSMNRHEWWRELAWISAITNDSKYAAELEYELASWSQQNPTAQAPSAWSTTAKEAWLLNSSLRAESWSWAYFGFLNHPNFTGAENSLFLYKLLQTGDYLYSAAVATSAFASNKTIVLGKGLLYLGAMFPELSNAATWESSARTLLFKCMDAQIYADGSHVEQSPGYIFNVSNDLLDARQIDRVNENPWPQDKRLKLANMIDSYWQFLSPNGKRPAIGDSYRNQSIRLFLKPNLILGTTRWPVVKPQASDVFFTGIDAVTPFLGAPNTPDLLGDRGKTYAMPVSGNYIMRSGDDKAARQIVFDAGPKGGSHGHLDLLSFELSGYSRPLISDPGAYKYDQSADRAYVVSTRAHNTLNVDGLNHAALEGAGNPDIIVSQWKTGSNFAQITATHRGYKAVSGSPVITRSMWYDLDGTIVIVDWAASSVRHNYQQSYNLQTEGDAANVVVDAANLAARTNYSAGGNVQIKAVKFDEGETAAQGPLTFVTNTASGDYKDDAYRFTLNQSGNFVVMVTLITAYDGTTPPNTTATLLNVPSANGVLLVRLTKNGNGQVLEFARPALSPLDSTASSRGTFNDIAFDSSNRLHLVYADRDTGALMYAVRTAAGQWSIPSIVDPPADSSAIGGYQYASLALNSSGHPAVAYFNGWHGDLKYAARNATSGTWTVQTVDSKGSTGLYPSLAFGRDNLAVISYYHRTDHDLKLAQSNGAGFTIAAVDTVGDVGRFSSLMLDPNRRTITRWAIGYEDTRNGNYKYAIQGDFDGGTRANGYTNYLVDNLSLAGGYLSMAFYDSGTSDNKRYKPAMSYYDAVDTALRFARSLDGGPTWSTETVTARGIAGLYTSLFFDSLGRPNIFYFNRTDNEAVRAIGGASWTFALLGSGGREIHTTLNTLGNVAYSSLNEATGLLNVFVI